MALVKFVSCDDVKFHALPQKDEGTLYFLQQSHLLYKGATPYSGGIYKTVTAFPETAAAERNTLYINTNTGEVQFFDGTVMVTVVKPMANAIEGAGDNSHTVSSKAVVDYVTAQLNGLNTGALADRVTAVEGKATANEKAIGVLNGTGEGSVSAAVAAAKTEAINTAAGDATTKANAAQAAAEKTASDALSAAKTALQANIDKKANAATTLAGYGIADAYTKTQTDTKISEAVANAHHLKRQVVNALPAVGEANEDTIYMVPKAAGIAGNEAGNGYTEHMLINGKFEQIGDTAVDLTNYATKTYADGKANDALASAKTYAGEQATAAKNAAISAAAEDAKTKADAAQAAAVAAAATDAQTKADAAQAAAEKTAAADATKKADAAKTAAQTYADGLAKNYATAAQGAKADTALQAADIVESSVNGKITVKGTDVAIHGLGSAAFTASSAYDKAGAASAAETAAKTHAENKIAEALTWGTL